MFWRSRSRHHADPRVQTELSRQQVAEQKRSNRIARISVGLSIVAVVVAAVTLTVALRVDTTPTRVTTVRPFGSGVVLDEGAVEVSGTCEFSSVLSNRPDAVRCFYELEGQDRVDDPCFRSPIDFNALTVACLASIDVTDDLSFVLVHVPSVPDLRRDVPTDSFVPFWLVLETGDRCFLASGAGPVVAGVAREDFYACRSEPDDDQGEYLAHTVVADYPIWTVHLIGDTSAQETLVKIVEAFR